MKKNLFLSLTMFGCTTLGFIMGIGCTEAKYKGMDDKYNILRMENVILKDYKKMYLNHLEMCDTLHKSCYQCGKLTKADGG